MNNNITYKFNPKSGNFERPPEIIQFSLDKNILVDANAAILNWEVLYSTYVTINGLEVESKGEKEFITDNQIDIIIIASNEVGDSVSQNLNLSINKEKPIIDSFYANSKYIIKNSVIIFTWDIKNYHSIEIDNGIGEVTNLKEYTISIDKTTVFTIKAKNYFGYEAKKQIGIEVYPIPLIDGYNSPKPQFSFDKINISNLNLKLQSLTIPHKDIHIPSLFFNTEEFIFPISTNKNINIINPQFKDIDLEFKRLMLKQNQTNILNKIIKLLIENKIDIINKIKSLWKKEK